MSHPSNDLVVRRWRIISIACAAAVLALSVETLAAAPVAVKAVGVTEHRFVKSAAAKKQLGEGCSARGTDGCATGMCLKTTKVRGTGHYCTSSCVTEQDCPETWLCREVVPGGSGRLCIPPSNWAGAAARVRPDGGAL